MGARQGVHVAVLMGGISPEHDVSICSGLNVLAALSQEPFRGTPIYIDRGGAWHFGHVPPAPDLAAPAGSGRNPGLPPPPASGNTLERLRSGEFDVVFIALHGPGGEDGSVQGLLRSAGVAFTGSDVLASALAMSKPLTKRVLRPLEVPFAEDVIVAPGPVDTRVREALSSVGLPCVVKPAEGGSSFGTRVVNDTEELATALPEAWRQGADALVEEFVAGVEVTCGVLGGGPEPAEALPLTEIAPRHDGFFDFRAKYTASACDEITPARVDPATSQRVQQLAVLAHETIGCEGMSRSDFIVATAGPVMLEINTIPGMTATSLLPQGAAAAGIDLAALVARVLEAALRKA